MLPREARITVSEVWQLALPAETRLLGGAEGLCHPVEWVASLRTAYPLFGALKEGYLALARLELARQLDARLTPDHIMDELYRAGACALVVDEALSPADCARADDLALPVLRLPEGTDLHSVEREVLRALVDREGQVARREVELHQQLQTLFDRGGTAAVLGEVARRTGGHIALIDDTGAVVVEAGGPAPSLHGQHIPVRAAGRQLGEIVFTGVQTACAPTDLAYPRKAAEICAAELLQGLARVETEERLGADLVERILDRSLSGEALAVRLARLGAGVSPESRYLVVSFGDGQREGAARRQAMAGDLAWAAQRDGASAVVATYRERSLVIVTLNAGRPPERPPALERPLALERQGRQWLSECLAGHQGASYAVGVGRVGVGLDQLDQAIRQAIEAADLGQHIQGRSGPHYYEELGLYRLLAGLRDQQELVRYYRETLGELLRYDRDNHTDLVHTLEVFFRENANATQSARALYVHRNTLAYRLQRISDITGLSLDDAEARLALQIACMIHRLARRD